MLNLKVEADTGYVECKPDSAEQYLMDITIGIEALINDVGLRLNDDAYDKFLDVAAHLIEDKRLIGGRK